MYRLRADGVISRVFDGEAVVLDVDQSMYLGANDAASLLWPRLVEGAERDQLIDALVEEYDLERDTAARDVDIFVEELRRRRLLDE